MCERQCSLTATLVSQPSHPPETLAALRERERPIQGWLLFEPPNQIRAGPTFFWTPGREKRLCRVPRLRQLYSW